MARFQAGCTALLALAFAAACAKDAPGGGEQIVAPDGSIEASTAQGSNSDRDSDGQGGRRFIAMRDDCDPRDPAWDGTGGCLLRRGNVTFAEFLAEADSPLAASVVGHQAWRNDPTYLVVDGRKSIRVRNEGGRTHTFTRVANFGAGRVPPLNKGLLPSPVTPVPECAPGATPDVAPGESIRVSGLAPGNHRFMCCFHPWMRAIVKVK